MAQYGNWLGILRYSLANNDGTHPSEAKQMSAEDAKWLTEALESMSVDEVKRMKELAAILADPIGPGDAEAEDKKLTALEELDMLVESIDNAKNLFIVGGYEPLLACLASDSQAIASRAAGTISTVVQNNPKAQEWALQAGTLEALSSVLARLEPASAGATTATVAGLTLHAKALTALSSLVRDSGPGQRRLLEETTARGAVADEAATGAGSTASSSSTSALEHVLRPLLLWRRFARAAVSAPSAAEADGDALAAAGRRLVRKAVFFLRNLVSSGGASTQAAAVLAEVTSRPALLRALVAMVEPPATAAGSEGRGELSDAADVRELALAVLAAAAAPVAAPVAPGGVVEDSSDTRSYTSLRMNQQHATAAGTAAATAAGSRTAPVTAPVATHSAALPRERVLVPTATTATVNAPNPNQPRLNQPDQPQQPVERLEIAGLLMDSSSNNNAESSQGSRNTNNPNADVNAALRTGLGHWAGPVTATATRAAAAAAAAPGGDGVVIAAAPQGSGYAAPAPAAVAAPEPASALGARLAALRDAAVEAVPTLARLQAWAQARAAAIADADEAAGFAAEAQKASDLHKVLTQA